VIDVGDVVGVEVSKAFLTYFLECPEMKRDVIDIDRGPVVRTVPKRATGVGCILNGR